MDGDSKDTGGDIELTEQQKIDAAVQKATSGLTANRDKILGEKKAIEAQLRKFEETLTSLGGDEGIRSLMEIRQRLEGDETTKLLATGKHDEWLEKKTAAMRASHQSTVESLTGKLKGAEERATKAETALRDQVLEIKIREQASQSEGFESSAFPDAMARARSQTRFDEDLGQHVFVDSSGEVRIGEDGKTPMSAAEWFAELKNVARHYWGESRGAGILGGRGGVPVTTEEYHSRLGRAKSQREFNALREKAKEGKKAPASFGGHRF